MAAALPEFPTFDMDIDPTSLGQRWKKWLARVENLLVALDIDSPKRKKALLLHYAGQPVQDALDTLPVPPAPGNVRDELNDYDKAVKMLNSYFMPQRNVEYEVYVFRQANQKQAETLDQFQTRLRQLAETCEFQNTDREVKSQIVQGCTSTRLRRKALRDTKLTLTDLLSHGRAMETSETQAQGIEATTTSTSVNAVTQGQNQRQHRGPRHQQQRSDTNKSCRNCGGQYPHKNGRESCPAYGRECGHCGKLNHFQAHCLSPPKTSGPGKDSSNKKPKAKRRQKRVNKVDTSPGAASGDSSSDDAYVFGIDDKHRRSPRATITVCGTPIEVMVDTGASVNVLDHGTYATLTNAAPLKPTKTRIYPYGTSKELPIKGELTATVESRQTTTEAVFYVTTVGSVSLLSYDTARELGLIKITLSAVSTGTERMVSDSLIEQNPELFTGIGKLANHQVKIHINESVQPVAQRHRRVPFHMRKKVETELLDLESKDVIERVNGPTPWVSPIVPVPKARNPDKVRICVDMRMPNTAVKRERHITPTIDDIIADVNGSTVFSKLDLNSGYHQLELEPTSRYITTFTTHLGLWRYKRLNFGISSAAEIFQNTVRQVIEGISGAINISDDILVHGKTQKQHDTALAAVFQRLRENHLTLHEAKCEFNKSTLKFFGHIFSADGMSADPEKVTAIRDAPPPENSTELRSLLGMAVFCSRYIEDFATITDPLRALTKKNVTWRWSDTEQKALEMLKSRITDSTVMAYFDPRKKTELIVDASPVGLGAILAQKSPGSDEPSRVIAYASRALTGVERRYSQTEREALAIVWGCEHFNLWLYGAPFTLVTDHKPLEAIFGNPSSKPPARIERWALRLQPYDFTIVYRAGKDNPADYMSRHPLPCIRSRPTESAEAYVNFAAEHATPGAMTLPEIKAATAADKSLQQVMQYIQTGKWYDVQDTLQSFYRVRDELSKTDDNSLVLRGTRIVMPETLQTRALNLAHEGHQGVVKTKALLREKVWFPGIDAKVANLVANCIPCQATTPERKAEPLQMSALPDRPWADVCMDFCGPYPSGDYLMVLIDEYTRFPIVELIRSTAASTVIPHLDRIFGIFGIPDRLKTDNGPPFQGHEFAAFAAEIGFKHRRITPLWPQANAEAERFMRTISKSVKASYINRKSWKREMSAMLRNYRSTPHSTTAAAPATLMFGRPIKTKLPELTKRRDPDPDVRQRDTRKKSAMKQHADRRSRAVDHRLTFGDRVLVRQQRNNKLTPHYDPRPYHVTAVKGTMITAQRHDHVITRNACHFKRLPLAVSPERQHPVMVEEESDDDDTDWEPAAPRVEPVEPDPVRQYPRRAHRPPQRYIDERYPRRPNY